MILELDGTILIIPIVGVNNRQPAWVETRLKSKKSLPINLVTMDGSLASITAATVAMQVAGKIPVAVKGQLIVGERLITNPYTNFQRELGFKAEPTSNEELICLFQQ